VKDIIVFVNKMDVLAEDEREEMAELIQLEIGELLATHGYEKVSFIFGSALKALDAIQGGDMDSMDTHCISELVAALDHSIADPCRDFDSPFMMPIEDVFSISGRGTVVSGRVERGVIKVGDQVEIVGLENKGDDEQQVVVTGTQAFHKNVDIAKAGMNVGLLLRGVKREEVRRGQVITIPGVVKPHTKGKAHIFVLTKEEGGRHTPFTSGYQPQFFFGTTDVTGVIRLENEQAIVQPGEQVNIDFELMKSVGMEEGIRFAIREGSKTVGAGIVTAVIE
jgi:elongation factor Tu